MVHYEDGHCVEAIHSVRFQFICNTYAGCPTLSGYLLSLELSSQNKNYLSSYYQAALIINEVPRISITKTDSEGLSKNFCNNFMFWIYIAFYIFYLSLLRFFVCLRQVVQVYFCLNLLRMRVPKIKYLP